MLCLRVQNLLPDPAYKLDPLLTPWTPGHENDNCDTLLTKKFVAISDQELQANLTNPHVTPTTPWGTTKVRLVARFLPPDSRLLCKHWVLASSFENHQRCCSKSER